MRQETGVRSQETGVKSAALRRAGSDLINLIGGHS
jgi:hypothetical protein